MLEITVNDVELYDEEKGFINVKGQVLRLEHSLVSISKWESKWHVPFLSTEKTREQTIDYIKCMTLTQNVNDILYYCLSEENLKKIKDYIDDPMTATTFSEQKNKGGNKEIITSELIYYWMIGYQIPVEFQKWHLNKLLTLIKVCEIKNTPPEKMSKADIMKRNAALNAARRKAHNTRG